MSFWGSHGSWRGSWPRIPAWKSYTLEVNTNYLQSNSREAVSHPPVATGSQYVITNPVQGASQTFRLKRPTP